MLTNVNEQDGVNLFYFRSFPFLTIRVDRDGAIHLLSLKILWQEIVIPQ